MVVIKEVKNMFWGITLEAGKRYTQTVDTSFHISCAALEIGTTDGGPLHRVAVMVKYEKVEFLLCTLDNKKVYQQAVDLNITEGEEVSFFINGQGVVHLTGYLVPEDTADDDFGGYSGAEMTTDDDEDSDEEIPQLAQLPEPGSKRAKRKKSEEDTSPKKKQKKVAEPEDDDDDYDSDNDPDFFEEMDLDLAKSDSDDESDDEDNSDDDDDSDDDEDSDDDDDDDDDDSEEDSEDDSEEAEKMDLSGSFIQDKAKTSKGNKKEKSPEKKNKTPAKDKTPGKKDKTPSAAAAPSKEEKSPKSAKKEKGKPEGEKKKPQEQAKTPKDKQKGGEAKTPKTEDKKAKQQQTPKAEANGKTPNTEGKKKKKQNQENGSPAKSAKKPQKTVLAGGTVVEEVKEGHGPEAKSGKMVHVYYKGTLKDGSVFDALTSGKPFKFRLGKSEVIKGWDAGLQGMKVGSKRKLTVPANQAYGNQRVGKIPPGSTLTFDVELKAVS